MKDQIKKLVDLAEKYVEYGTKSRLSLSEFNKLGDDGIYLSFGTDYDYWVCYICGLKGIAIDGVDNEVSIPFGTTDEAIELAYDRANGYLNDVLIPNMPSSDENKKARIAELEREIEELMGEVKDDTDN